MLLNCACALLPCSQRKGSRRELKGAEGRGRERSGRHDSTAGIAAAGIRPQRLGDTGRQAGDGRNRREAKDPGSGVPASGLCRNWETQGDKWGTRTRAGRQAAESQHLASSVTASGIRPQSLTRLGERGKQAGDTISEPASQHLASDRSHHSIWHLTPKEWETQTRPRSQRHRQATSGRRRQSTERQAGDRTPEPMSQHLASERRDWETQGDETRRHMGHNRLGDTGTQKRKTTRSRRHSFWPPTTETEGDKWETRPRSQRQHCRECETQDVTASGLGPASHLNWETQGDKWDTTQSRRHTSDRRDWETQGDKRETTPEPASQHLASDRRS